MFAGLLVLQFVALLFVIELLLAWFHPVAFRKPRPVDNGGAWTKLLHRPSTAPGLHYELNPGVSADVRGVKISINSLGFRGPEVSRVKPPNTIRIVAMGASVAFGWTVPIEESYPAQLERLLNERVQGTDRHYEVFNMGVGGYSTRDEVAALEAKGLPLDPDLVIVDFHPNGPETEPIQPLHLVFHEPLWWEKWNLLRLLAYGRRLWGIETLGHGSEYHYLASPKGPHWPKFLEAYDKLKALCDARGLKVIIPIFPTYGKMREWSEYEFADIHEQVKQTALDHGFVPVDMFPIYAQSGLTVQQIAADSEHPGAPGLLLSAQELERVILARHQELLKVPPPR